MFETLELAQEAYNALLEEKKQLEEKVASLERSKSGLQADLAKLKPIKKFLDEHPDFDPKEYADLQAKYDQLLEQAEGKAKNAVDGVKTSFEGRIKVLEQKLEQAEKARVEQEQQAEQARRDREEADLRSEYLAELSKPEYRVYSPQQMLVLTRHQVKRGENGTLVFSRNEYEELPIGEAIALLQRDEGYANQFRANTGGSGTPVGGTTGRGQRVNPYLPETRNFTEQGKLERDNPTLAKQLQAEALEKTGKTKRK